MKQQCWRRRVNKANERGGVGWRGDWWGVDDITSRGFLPGDFGLQIKTINKTQ